MTNSCCYSGLDLCLEHPHTPAPGPLTHQGPRVWGGGLDLEIQGPETPEQVKKPQNGVKPEGRMRGREEKGRQAGRQIDFY